MNVVIMMRDWTNYDRAHDFYRVTVFSVQKDWAKSWPAYLEPSH